MEPDLMTLTSSAATTLVRLMTTDGWDRFKAAIMSMWRRAQPERAETVDADLAAARLELLTANEAHDEQAEVDLVGEWRSRLQRLVIGDPELQHELRTLVEEYRPAVAEVETTRIGSVKMEAKATGHGRVYQAGGDQKIVER
jgi:hypothetical protein